jgi:hypothetical protein
MATRSPTPTHGYWGNTFALPTDLPNVAGATIQSPTLEVGDTAFVSSASTLYVCINATLGAAVWSAMTSGLVPANFDAFGRLRVSNPTTIFDSKLVYDDQPLYWAEEQTGGAPLGVYDQPNACVTLSVTGGGAETSVRQTRRFFNYQPGKSQLIFQTFNANNVEANTIKRIGYFDALDGFFFELDGTTIVGSGLSFVRRSSSSNPSVPVPQASWNLDTLDGSGGSLNPSGVNLKVNAVQILVLDFEWLGVGSARMGFVINGQIIYAHRFDCANIQQNVYMQTPNLPLRYEIEGTLGGAGSLDCICGTVISEGGQGSTGSPFGFYSPRTPNVANNASTTLLSIRHRAGSERITIIPTLVTPLTVGNGASQWELLYNPTFALAPAWATSRGFCELDTPALVAPGTAGQAAPGTGTVIASGVFSSNAPAGSLGLRDTTLTLGADVAGTSDVISLVVTNVSGGNEQYLASLNWLALT